MFWTLGEGPSSGLLRDCTTGCGTDGSISGTTLDKALTGTLDTEAEVELGTPGVWDNIARRAWARDRGYLVIFGY